MLGRSAGLLVHADRHIIIVTDSKILIIAFFIIISSKIKI